MINTKKGITLIELLVVMSVIGILAGMTILIINPTTHIKQSRDARRKGDLSQIQNALEMYRADNGKYPGSVAGGYCVPSTCLGAPSPTPSFLNPYMNSIPKDPTANDVASCTDANAKYLYGWDSSRARYSLFVKLENTADPDAQAAKPPPCCGDSDTYCSPSSSNCQTYTIPVLGGSSCAGAVYNYWVNNP